MFLSSKLRNVNYVILCCPVLNPQMTGEGVDPTLLMLNESVAHAPMDPSLVSTAGPVAPASPRVGEFMEKVYIDI